MTIAIAIIVVMFVFMLNPLGGIILIGICIFMFFMSRDKSGTWDGNEWIPYTKEQMEQMKQKQTRYEPIKNTELKSQYDVMQIMDQSERTHYYNLSSKSEKDKYLREMNKKYFNK